MDKPTNTLNALQKKAMFFSVRRGSLLVLVAGASGLLFACSYVPNLFTPSKRAEFFAASRASRASSDSREPPFVRPHVLSQPITLFDAMARALKQHLESRITLQQKATSQEQLDLSHFRLLPQVAAAASLKAQHKSKASPGSSPLVGSATTVQEQSKTTTNLITVWDMLDFGMRVMYARQESDRTLSNKENQRRAVYTILQDVRTAFWRVAAAQNLENTIGPIIQQARNALLDSSKVEQQGLKLQLEAIRFQKILLKNIQQLQEFRQQLRVAKTAFAALIKLPPGSIFELDIPGDVSLISTIDQPLEEMEQLALDHRLDVQETMQSLRISRDNVRKAMLLLLPGLEFRASDEQYNNDLPLYAQWEEAGARVVWKILDILQNKSATPVAENAEELVRVRHLTLHMAILTQVHLSYRQYLHDRRKFQAAEEIDAVDRRILQNFNVASRKDDQSRLEYISSATSAIRSRMQLYQAYADVQNAVGRVFVAFGSEQTPKAVPMDEASVAVKGPTNVVMDRDEYAVADVSQEFLDNFSPFVPGKTSNFATQQTDGFAVSLLEEQPATGGWDSAILREGPVILTKKRPATASKPVPSTTSSPQVLEKPPVMSAASAGVAKKNISKISVATVPGAAGEVEAKLFEEIQGVLKSWAKAWSRRDLEAYLGFYAGQKFLPPRGQLLEVWHQRTQKAFRALTFLQVEIDELQVVRESLPLGIEDHFEAGWPTEFLLVSLRESYRSSNLQRLSKKLLVLGKEADGWKIYREAASKNSPPGVKSKQTSPGFAIQIASLSSFEGVEKVRSEWLKKAIQLTVVETLDEKKRPRYSVRIAHFAEKDHALVFKWFLKLTKGMDSMIVPASAEGQGVVFESDKLPQDAGYTDATPSHVGVGTK